MGLGPSLSKPSSPPPPPCPPPHSTLPKIQPNLMFHCKCFIMPLVFARSPLKNKRLCRPDYQSGSRWWIRTKIQLEKLSTNVPIKSMTGDRSNCGELRTDSDSLHLTQLKQDMKHGLSRNGAPGPVGRVSGRPQIYVSMKYLIRCRVEGIKLFSGVQRQDKNKLFCEDAQTPNSYRGRRFHLWRNSRLHRTWLWEACFSCLWSEQRVLDEIFRGWERGTIND